MITITELQNKKSFEKITALTAYDALFASIIDVAGVDIALVGDSLGMVIKGDANTLTTTMSDMLYHTKIVAKALKNSFLIVDMPYKSYNNPAIALMNANKLYQAGAKMVKLEGGSRVLAQVKTLIANDIAVCGHLGLEPQSIIELGGYKVQGRTKDSANKILADAHNLAAAGVKLLLLECIPAKLATKITNELKIPTIGIGAGVDCDGQILVATDILGMGKLPSFAKDFLATTNSINGAVSAFIKEVKNNSFPTNKHSF